MLYGAVFGLMQGGRVGCYSNRSALVGYASTKILLKVGSSFGIDCIWRNKLYTMHATLGSSEVVCQDFRFRFRDAYAPQGCSILSKFMDIILTIAVTG